MYSVESVKRGVANPRLVFQECNRIYHNRLGRHGYNPDGIDIFEHEWHCLSILDACRYDLFARVSELPGTLDAVESRGSATKDFIRGNFHGRRFHDTVYVTASPMLYRHRDTIDTEFHDIINVWQDEGWNDEYRTVMPGTVTREAIAARERYPNKRLLVHYLQPHYPFVGETGRRHFELDQLDFQWETVLRDDTQPSRDVVWQAYEENLAVALPHVRELIAELDGTHVVTADHGQVFGGRSFPFPIREYGHPQGIYIDELTRVPWLTVDTGDGPRISADPPVTTRNRDHTDQATRRLRDLGYVD